MIGLPYAVHALVLLRGEEGADLDGGAEVHALRADDIAGERVSDIGAFLSLRLHLTQRDLEDARMRLAVAGDARKRDVLKVVADAVGLQHIEYRIQRSGVRDDAGGCYKERIRFRTPGTRGCRIPDRKKMVTGSWTERKSQICCL